MNRTPSVFTVSGDVHAVIKSPARFIDNDQPLLATTTARPAVRDPLHKYAHAIVGVVARDALSGNCVTSILCVAPLLITRSHRALS